jgi:putative NIF3 family GTP cyclohydrolase 1 type 2
MFFTATTPAVIYRCDMNRFSRREFVALAATATGAAPFVLSRGATAAGAAVTAQQVVDRIKQQVGVDWKTETLDTFKAGDPSTLITGIVTTTTPTMNVLERAVKAGANFIVSCEPTFYSRADKPSPPTPPGAAAGASSGASSGAADAVRDPVFAAKDALIAKHKLVVWRFSDHWRLRKPDPFAQGLRDVLGWTRFGQADDPSRVTMPAVTLDALASQIKKTLGTRGGIRVMGDPKTQVRTLGLLPGSTPIQAALRVLPNVDAIVAGEVREWETVEYVRDTITTGGRKGLILIGRLVSEDPGMQVCARWLGTIVPEVRATAIPAGDPYWRPR